MQERTQKCYTNLMVSMINKDYIKPNIKDPNCPSRRVLDIIADKWTGLIIWALVDGTLRYSQLRREVGGISHKMLSQTLRELEQKNLVYRKVYDTSPPQVEYSLTPLGRTLMPVLGAIFEWAEDHVYELETAVSVD